MAGNTEKQERFVWPPSLTQSEAVEVRLPSADPTPAPSPPHQEGFFARAERALLDPTAEPLRERAARIGWSPDEPGEYCDRCGHTSGPHEADEMGCGRCAGTKMYWQRVVRLGAYDADLSGWIQEVKFTRWTRLGVDLGRWLGESIRAQRVMGEGVGAGKNPDNDPWVVVAMPISLRRRWSRGIHHAGVIARGVSLELGLPTVRALRRAHRPSQRSVAVSSRRANVRGSFVCRAKTGISGRKVLLVDDVLTTGATAREAARILLAEGGASAVVVGVLGVAGEDA